MSRASEARARRLAPSHPNAGIEAAYRAKLREAVDEMHRSIVYWLGAAYKANEPRMALDAVPATELQAAIRKLARRWENNFNDAAPHLARYFARMVYARTTAQMMAILKKGGFTVQFKMTPEMRDVFNATVQQNVELIRSIPEQYLTQVQGAVMRSVQAGRDLGSLAQELTNQHGVTRRRAALIARSQNNLATASMTKVRQVELGLRATWLHSAGGREPRPTHVANSGKPYDPAKGWYDPAVKKHIWPGELINCRCVSRSMMPGLS